MAMGSTNLDLIVIIIIFFVFLILTVHCIEDFDDQIRSYAFRNNTRHKTGSLYEISLPKNLSNDVKASVVTIRNSMFWRKGANFSGVMIPSKVTTTPYAKRIAFVYEEFNNHSSPVYFRLSDNNYSFVSPVIGFSVYDSGNDHQKLNLSIKKDNPILIRFNVSSGHQGIIECVEFGENFLLLSFSNTTGRNYECATTNSRGYYALVALNKKESKLKPKLVKKKWWFVLGVIGISILGVVLIVVVVKLVKKKNLREMERESEKSESIGNIWIGGRSRMPAATMVRTQPCLEYHEDLPSSSNIP